MTTKSHEVHVAGLLKSHQAFRHSNIVPLQMRGIAFPGLRSETWGTRHFLYSLLPLPRPAPHHPVKHGVHGLRRLFLAAIEPPAQQRKQTPRQCRRPRRQFALRHCSQPSRFRQPPLDAACEVAFREFEEIFQMSRIRQQARPILQRMHDGSQKLEDDSALPPEQRHAAMHALFTKADQQMRVFLTDPQKKTLDEMEAQMHQEHHGSPDASPAPSPQN